MDARAQERPAGRNTQVLAQEYVICVILLFFLFCHLFYLISAELKTISREDAHLMYPRYPRGFIYVHDLLPTPPPNLCESGLGVPLLCTCVAFSLLLN